MSRFIDVLPLLLAVLLLYKARLVQPLNSFNYSYLDIVPCRSIRAFFALAIMLHHLSQHTASGHIFPIFTLFSFTVPIFFFFSGYGMMKKFIAAPAYSKYFIPRHLPMLLLPALVVLFIFKLLYALMGEPVSFGRLLYMIIHGDIILVILWYILVISLLYIAFGTAMLFFKEGHKVLCLMGIFSLIYIYFGIKFSLGQWMYNSFHLFPIGLAWALYEKQLLSFIKKFYWPCLFFCGFLFLFVWQYFDQLFALWPVQEMRLIISLVRNAAFTLAFVLMTLKLKLGNPILDRMGKVSLELYLLHPVFLLLFRCSLIYIGDDLLFCLAVISATIASSLVLSRPYNNLCRKYSRLFNS